MTEQPRCDWFDAAGPEAGAELIQCPKPGTEAYSRTLPPSGTVMTRRYCPRHLTWVNALDAAREIRDELIATVHRWVAGASSLAELEAIANQDVAATQAVRRVVPEFRR